MVQGRVRTGLSQAFTKQNGPPKPEVRFKPRERFQKRWKILIYTSVLLTSLFIIAGIVIYMNLYPSNHCRKGYLNVHVVPYMPSNFDPFLTPDEHYENDVKRILDFVIRELEKDEKRRFTLTETYSLWRWWSDQSEAKKASVRRLLAEGRLEIAGGGWSVPDEAATHYANFIDQYAWGLRRLEEIAGREVVPEVSLLIDNHGHSRELATLQRGMDFRAVVLGGISPQEQCRRRIYKKMEFLWSDGGVFGVGNEKPNIFASILDERAFRLGNYFDRQQSMKGLDELFNSIMCQSMGYRTNNILVPVGDFLRPAGEDGSTFSAIESIINDTTAIPKYKLNIFYSTPSNYINAVEYSENRWWRSYGEFLPYAESDHDYWTGYYSSRPSLKYLERKASELLQILRQMLSVSELGKRFSEEVTQLREAVGLSQHHKGAIGVASRAITDFFHRLLHSRLASVGGTAEEALNKMSKGNATLKYASCLKLNISECPTSEDSRAFVLTVYNPSSRLVSRYVRLPVTRGNYLVRTGDGESLPIQIVDIPQQILTIPGRRSAARQELVFRAVDVPPLGFRSFYVTAANEPYDGSGKAAVPKRIRLVRNERMGRISAVERDNATHLFSQEILFYSTSHSRNSVFRPENRPQAISESCHLVLLNDGDLVTEYLQTFGPWASQLIRVYRDEDFVEFKWIVGPIPFRFFVGKEVVTLFGSEIKSGSSFFVDANGRGLERRRRSPQLENDLMGPYIARNYRSVHSHIAIEDAASQLHVFNDRVQGGTSIFEGEIELMIHRRLFGFVNEIYGLYERDYSTDTVATGQHWVFIGSREDGSLRDSIDNFAATSHWEPWYFFADAGDVPYDAWRNGYQAEFSAFRNQPPKNLRVLTLEPWKEGKLLLRLENIAGDPYEKIHVNIQELFSAFTVREATEVTLAGSGFKDADLQANSAAGDTNRRKLTNFCLVLYPSKIRTFLVDVEPAH